MAAGTYLVVEKLRLLAYRNLCLRVHSHLAREHDQGRAEFKHKQDLEPYEVAFAWQDGFDSDETICLLARLICIGAIRAYLSDSARKIVFSKAKAFPPPSDGWGTRA